MTFQSNYITSKLFNILLYFLVPFASIIAGGALGIFRPPGSGLRSAILHFAAGVVFSVVVVELLPDIVRVHTPLEVALGFGMGIFTMLSVRFLSRRLEEKETTGMCAKNAESIVTSIARPVLNRAANAQKPATPNTARRLCSRYHSTWWIETGLFDGRLLQKGCLSQRLFTQKDKGEKRTWIRPVSSLLFRTGHGNSLSSPSTEANGESLT